MRGAWTRWLAAGCLLAGAVPASTRALAQGYARPGPGGARAPAPEGRTPPPPPPAPPNSPPGVGVPPGPTPHRPPPGVPPPGAARLGLRQRIRYDHAFPGSQPGGFDHHRRSSIHDRAAQRRQRGRRGWRGVGCRPRHQREWRPGGGGGGARRRRRGGELGRKDRRPALRPRIPLDGGRIPDPGARVPRKSPYTPMPAAAPTAGIAAGGPAATR